MLEARGVCGKDLEGLVVRDGDVRRSAHTGPASPSPSVPSSYLLCSQRSVPSLSPKEPRAWTIPSMQGECRPSDLLEELATAGGLGARQRAQLAIAIGSLMKKVSATPRH